MARTKAKVSAFPKGKQSFKRRNLKKLRSSLFRPRKRKQENLHFSCLANDLRWLWNPWCKVYVHFLNNEENHFHNRRTWKKPVIIGLLVMPMAFAGIFSSPVFFFKEITNYFIQIDCRRESFTQHTATIEKRSTTPLGECFLPCPWSVYMVASFFSIWLRFTRRK